MNDLSFNSNFQTTLFAYDILLQLSENNLKELNKLVNNKLTKIDMWLRKHKISISISKTNTGMLFNKSTNASINKNFEIKTQRNVVM